MLKIWWDKPNFHSLHYRIDGVLVHQMWFLWFRCIYTDKKMALSSWYRIVREIKNNEHKSVLLW